MSLATLARMLRLPLDEAEASLYSERAARAVISRRALGGIAALLLTGTACSFAPQRMRRVHVDNDPTRRVLGERDGSIDRPFLSVDDALEVVHPEGTVVLDGLVASIRPTKRLPETLIFSIPYAGFLIVARD